MVKEWAESLQKLTCIAKTQPQAAYSCFVKGFVHKFTYFMRTITDIKAFLCPLDKAIDGLIKVIFDGHDFNTTQRKLWCLPVHMGGMGLPIPSEISGEQYTNS